MKLMHRNGMKFVCGWEPPAISLCIGGFPIETVAPRVLYWLRTAFEAIALTGSAVFWPAPVLHSWAWVWIGICCVVSVTSSVPAASAC